VSHFDVPATYRAPAVPDIWNETPGPVVRPRCVAGMRNGMRIEHAWCGEPVDVVPAGGVRIFVFGAADAVAVGRPLGDKGPLGVFTFPEASVLRVGDAVRVDGHLVGHLCGFGGPYAVIHSWHPLCGGALEVSQSTLLEVGGAADAPDQGLPPQDGAAAGR